MAKNQNLLKLQVIKLNSSRILLISHIMKTLPKLNIRNGYILKILVKVEIWRRRLKF